MLIETRLGGGILLQHGAIVPIRFGLARKCGGADAEHALTLLEDAKVGGIILLVVT